MDELHDALTAFAAQQIARCRHLGLDLAPYPIGHVAYRTDDLDEYVRMRDEIEHHCVANVENDWSGRPISKLLLREPLPVSDHHSIPLIELIPPPHRPEYPLGVEHVGFALGDDVDRVGEQFVELVTEKQDQGPFNQPYLITFDDGTGVKLHRWPLAEVVRKEGHEFIGQAR